MALDESSNLPVVVASCLQFAIALVVGLRGVPFTSVEVVSETSRVDDPEMDM